MKSLTQKQSQANIIAHIQNEAGHTYNTFLTPKMQTNIFGIMQLKSRVFRIFLKFNIFEILTFFEIFRNFKNILTLIF